ncbi:immunity protein YezG family protein [Bacillus atrophaeus]
MIPSEWTKIILYAEILDGSSEVYFSSTHHKVKIISILYIQ